MTLLQEFLSKDTQLDNQERSDLSPEDESHQEEDLPNESPEQDNDDYELDQIANNSTENPNKMGLIRSVKGAKLIYKRETEDGTYEELWCYTGGDRMKDDLKIRKAILAGTDIPPTKTTSPDGNQTYLVWAAGNAELLNIKGLPQ